VLLDLTLPGMSGREILQEFRRMRHDIKVIITTAYGRSRALETLGVQQPWHYIRKPFQIGELTELIRSACQNSE